MDVQNVDVWFTLPNKKECRGFGVVEFKESDSAKFNTTASRVLTDEQNEQTNKQHKQYRTNNNLQENPDTP